MAAKNTFPSAQTFEDVIKTNGIYVDKTSCLARLLESADKTFFLARPRLFGKYLTVSVLKSLLLEKRIFFKGWPLKISLRKRDSPRPVWT